MIDKQLREAFRFMLDHAGHSTPPGRAACALSLARAERLLHTAQDFDADRPPAHVTWTEDDEPYEHGGLSPAEVTALFASGEWTGPYGCILYVDGEVIGSLWGITLGRADLNDPYRRVVEAELASEHEDDIRQALGDARDAQRLDDLTQSQIDAIADATQVYL